MLRDHVSKLMELKMLHDECLVRKLLGLWVSELEPAIAYRDGEIVGLTIADAPLGSYPAIFNPLTQ